MTIRPERLLEEALVEVAPLYDHVILDCPTRADGILSANAVRAATLVVLVVETGAFALQGAVRAHRLFQELAEELGREIPQRVLATLFEPSRELAREILIGLHGRFGEEMFDTVIHVADELRESIAFGLPVDEYAPDSAATRQFRALAEELVQIAREQEGAPGRFAERSLAARPAS